MLDPEHFNEIQQAIVIVFGPWVLWGLAFLIAGAFLIAVGDLFLALYRRMVKGV